MIFPKNNFFKLTIDKSIGIKPFFSIVKYKIIVKGKFINCKNSEFDILILLLIKKITAYALHEQFFSIGVYDTILIE